MPVTLRLSGEFYERLGQKAADDLVQALNAVDESYRSEFRELFQAHFSRLESRLDALEHRLESKVDAGVFESRMASLESRLDARLAELKAELLRWMFLFWVGTMGTVLAITRL